ncbi:unnamed protein product [Amoebophrya sp. A120]|nr:unnamed protein product [Amoebophrya sp. A120]|eukprot:GSA120T00025161001.1
MWENFIERTYNITAPLNTKLQTLEDAIDKQGGEIHQVKVKQLHHTQDTQKDIGKICSQLHHLVRQGDQDASVAKQAMKIAMEVWNWRTEFVADVQKQLNDVNDTTKAEIQKNAQVILQKWSDTQMNFSRELRENRLSQVEQRVKDSLTVLRLWSGHVIPGWEEMREFLMQEDATHPTVVKTRLRLEHIQKHAPTTEIGEIIKEVATLRNQYQVILSKRRVKQSSSKQPTITPSDDGDDVDNDSNSL